MSSAADVELARMKILVVDDHALIREALHGVLQELKPEAGVIDASSCREALQLAQANAGALDLVLLDLGLPDGDGFDTLGELRDLYPAVAIVVLSASKDRDSVTKALDLGALGFIPKSASRAVMVSALQLVLAGGIYVPPEILQRPQDAPMSAPASAPMPAPSPSELGLTERQIDVLALMMQGKSNKAVCRELDLAEATVKNHITAILRALKVTNRTEAVLAVAAFGWKLKTIRP
jgi:DNA-binding NarL/FixJ family response regulator